MSQQPAYPSDAEILAIVVRKGIRNVLYWGAAVGVVALTGRAFLAAPVAVVLLLSGLWCAFGIVLSFVIAAGRLFGLQPAEPYDAPRMWVAGGVRLIEGLLYLGYSILLYRLFFA